MTTIEVRGACPHDCPDTCAWIATVTDGVVTKVRGDADHPITAGHLCVKTLDYHERAYRPDRITTPLIRTGPKGTFAFREATWAEALAATRAGLERVIERRGAEAILPFSYLGTQGVLQGSSLDRRFAHALGTADLGRTICLNAGAWAWALTYPNGWPAPDIEDAADSDLVVAWGANMVSTHLHFWPFFLAARRKGATIVCVDPVRTKTARASDVHLQLRPGSDGALALGMLHILFAEGLVDRDFLSTRTAGADDLEARATEWPVERAARATGLPSDTIAAFARRFGAATAPFIKLGPGAQRHAQSGQAFRAVLALPAVTGAWRHPAGGVHVHSAGGFANAGAAMERPDLREGKARPINMVQLGRALAGTVDDRGAVDALIVYNSNPAVVCPDSTAVRTGLARDDLFTVVAEHGPTETVAFADVVLPATTQLEHLDVLWSWGHRYLTLNRPAIVPVGQARPNTEIFRLLSAELGLSEPALYDDDEALLATYLAAYDAAVVATLHEQGYVKITPAVDPDAKAMLRNDAMSAFGLDPVPDAADADHDDRLLVITPKSHHFLNSTFVDSPRLRRMAGDAHVLLSMADAAKLGIVDGAAVRVESEHGAVNAPALVTDEVLAGTAVVFSNWWHRDLPGGAGTNSLTGQDLTDLGGAPQFSVRATVTAAAPG
jgi:anaerobic selenocysteine-containing dehydrogenase